MKAIKKISLKHHILCFKPFRRLAWILYQNFFRSSWRASYEVIL